MVKIQIELPNNLNKFIEVKKALLGLKDKRETIISIIKEDLDSHKELNLREALKS